jgi:single-strand DNA-binding protein
MNEVILLGGLTKDPEQIQGTEKTLCKLNIAVSSNYTKEDGARPAEFFNIAVWGKLADNCLRYLKKGSRVVVAGALQNRVWEKDGVKKYAVEIVAREVNFVSSPKKDEEQKMTPVKDDGLPF